MFRTIAAATAIVCATLTPVVAAETIEQVLTEDERCLDGFRRDVRFSGFNTLSPAEVIDRVRQLKRGCWVKPEVEISESETIMIDGIRNIRGKAFISGFGGRVDGAITFGYWLGSNGFEGIVEGLCRSACATVFSFTHNRVIEPGASVGVHAPSFTNVIVQVVTGIRSCEGDEIEKYYDILRKYLTLVHGEEWAKRVEAVNRNTCFGFRTVDENFNERIWTPL